ncbi:unnamed protein product [Urochloa decumbens]|uniref:F-box protein AT5G49610-like beta-propeller domain-containing protein n=1 Tax=Urochloa decumbens TaxID=240449 RepID=A0ABC8VWN3_9POAL
MEPPPQKRRRTTAEESRTSIHDIPDDLLRQILLRLDSPLWIAFVPSPPRPPINRGRFALDFLLRGFITTAYWEVSDCHGGLVLLRDSLSSLTNIIVCDPLTRRYQGIPHPPVEKRLAYTTVTLLDGDDGDISISSFRVIYRSHQAPHVCVFSAADGWRFLKESPADGGRYKYMANMGHFAGRIDGSLYLGFPTGNVKVLDNASFELFEVDLPIGIDMSKPPNRSAFTVVHGVGRDPTSPPTTRIIHVHGEDLEVFRRVRGGHGSEWVLEHSIPKLSEATRGLLGCRPDQRLEWTEVHVISVGTGIAVLSAGDRTDKKWFFSVDMDTEEMKVVPNEDYCRTMRTFTYTLPWRQCLRACPC